MSALQVVLIFARQTRSGLCFLVFLTTHGLTRDYKALFESWARPPCEYAPTSRVPMWGATPLNVFAGGRRELSFLRRLLRLRSFTICIRLR